MSPLKLKWINHACFQLTTDSKVLYFDPYEIPAGMTPADLVLASHDHYDHLDPQAVQEVLGPATILVCPRNCTGKVEGVTERPVQPGDALEFDDVKIEVVPAYNPDKKFHPKKKGWVGFVVEVNGKRVYHAGDTDQIPEMGDLGPIDVALLPVGDTYTMGFEEAVAAAGVIHPEICVPMHHWDKDLEPFKQQLEATHPDVTCAILADEDLEF